MSTADRRRDALVEQLADHVLVTGLAGASLRLLARAVGTSDRMLLYYFADKDALMAAVLERLAGRLTVLLDAHRADTPLRRADLERRLADVLLTDALWPYMCLWLELAASAARAEGFARETGSAIGRAFLEWGRGQLAGGNMTDAARVLVTIEGLALLKAVGLEAVGAVALTDR